MNLFMTWPWLNVKNPEIKSIARRHQQRIRYGFLAVCVVLAMGALSAAAQIPLSRVSQVAVNGTHSCALLTTGAVKCWGDNRKGELGDGTTTQRQLAVDVAGLSAGITSIATGERHVCALTNAGGVKCWGDNNLGALGDNSRIDRWVPVDVVGLTSGVTAITTGLNHSCALTSSGGVKCWGYLLEPTDTSSHQLHLTPVDVVGLTSDVAAITAGNGHTCALTNIGGVKCWGDNLFNVLGYGLFQRSPTPVDVIGLSSGVMQIDAGLYHTCALLNTGVLKCWGRNQSAELGDNTTLERTAPVTAAILSSTIITSVVVGDGKTCVLTANGGIKCWGAGYGNTPVDVVGLALDVSSHSCAIITGGEVRCWGSNVNGQLADNSTIDRLVPVTALQSFSPLIGAATAGNAQAIVRFSPPSDDSGSAITGYTVQSNSGDGIDIYAGTTNSHTGLSDLSHLVTGLVNGRSYTFTVTAMNALGTGWPSAASNRVTPSLGSSSTPASSSSLSSVAISSSSIESSAPASSSFASSAPASSSIASSLAAASSSISSVSLSSSSIATSVASSIASSVGACSLVIGVTFGATNSGTLATTDCTSGARGTNYYTDRYSFAGAPGQLIAIQLSGSFDTFVNLKNPSGSVIASNDDGGGGTNSRIPATSGNFTIPAGATGIYVIEVTSFSSLATGSYSLTVTSAVAASSSSSLVASSSASSVSSSVSSASPCNTVVAAVSGVTNSGALAVTDCTSGARGASYYTDRYSFTGTSGQLISIQLTSSAFDSYVYLKNPSGTVVASNDDGGGGTNSRIPATSGNFTLPGSGTYVIEVTSYTTLRTGAYSMLLIRQ